MKSEDQIRAELARHEKNRDEMRARLVEIAQQRQRLEAERGALNHDLMVANGMIAMAYDMLDEKPKESPDLPPKAPSKPTAGPKGAKVKRTPKGKSAKRSGKRR
jgi:hypothetical protein